MEDSDGLRYFSWDYSGLKLLTETDEQGEVTALYSHGYSAIPGIGSVTNAQKFENDTVFDQTTACDHRGSVYRLTNDDGDVVFSAEYNAFGEVLDESNTGATNRFGYQSNWCTLKDSDNKLVLSPARVYSANLGRFLQKDMLFQMTLLERQGSYKNSIFNQAYQVYNNYGLYRSFSNNPSNVADVLGQARIITENQEHDIIQYLQHAFRGVANIRIIPVNTVLEEFQGTETSWWGSTNQIWTPVSQPLSVPGKSERIPNNVQGYQIVLEGRNERLYNQLPPAEQAIFDKLYNQMKDIFDPNKHNGRYVFIDSSQVATSQANLAGTIELYGDVACSKIHLRQRPQNISSSLNCSCASGSVNSSNGNTQISTTGRTLNFPLWITLIHELGHGVKLLENGQNHWDYSIQLENLFREFHGMPLRCLEDCHVLPQNWSRNAPTNITTNPNYRFTTQVDENRDPYINRRNIATPIR